MVVPADGIPASITLPEDMAFNNMAQGVNSLVIQVPGFYKVDYSLIMQSMTGTFGVVFAVRVNGAVIPSLSTGLVATADFESLSTSAIIPLASGDVLDLVAFSASGGTMLFGPSQNATLVAVLLNS